MKKFLKNKFMIITIITVILSTVYIWINKTIKQQSSINNEEIITKENNVNNNENLDNTELNKDEEKIEQSEIHENEVEDSENEEKTAETENKIFVYVTGEVNEPGIVKLNENSRIIDAINSAGGTTNEANISKINLAYVLEDGMKVNVPNKEDIEKDSNFEYITMNPGDGKNNYTSENEKSLNNKSDKGSTNKSKVNINTATQTELETLPGIGPSTALKIINYRNENGKFSSIEEIKNVSGIGDSKFEKIKNYIII